MAVSKRTPKRMFPQNDDVQHKDEPIFVISSEEEDGQDPIKAEFFANHTHLLQGEINYQSVSATIEWIIAENLRPLKEGQKNKTLTLYINSPGGDLYNAFGLIDMMHASKYPVRTIGLGNLMSAATLILACGHRGERCIAPHTGVMVHQFYTDMQGKEHELQAGMKELDMCRDRIERLLISHCRISESIVKKKLLQPSDVWLTAEEAIKLKLADKIFKHF